MVHIVLLIPILLGLGQATTLGPVVGGYDVVEFRHLQPTDDGVLGTSTYSYDLLTKDYSTDASKKMLPTNWTFYFKNAENLKTFAASPWAYVPRYGGF